MGGEPFVLNSGRYPLLLERGLEARGYEGWRGESKAARADGRHVGCAVAYFMDKSGLGVYETAGIDVDLDGTVRCSRTGPRPGRASRRCWADRDDTLGVPPIASRSSTVTRT